MTNVATTYPSWGETAYKNPGLSDSKVERLEKNALTGMHRID
ncbi:hypothetical protein [Zunongwangia sp.]